jgi:hypothetical protein
MFLIFNFFLEGGSLMKAKTLLDDATASPKYLHFEDSGASITDVVYISSQEMEVDHYVENVPIGDVASAPPSSSPKVEAHLDTIKLAAKGIFLFEVAISFLCFIDLPSVATKVIYLRLIFFLFLSDCDEIDVNIGIDISMSYASEDPQSPFSNDHTPLCSMYFHLILCDSISLD